VKFPKPKVPDYDFSFSGLKTAVRQLEQRQRSVEGTTRVPIKDIAASFQETVIDALIEKTLAVAKAKRAKSIVVTGGVACNSRLREKMAEMTEKTDRKAYFASPVFCTDNAAMIAYVGGRKLLAGESSPLSLNAVANLSLKT
jgi:N6-L-threonylcarbamoyladenine synthase